MPKQINGQGNPRAKLLILGEAPGFHEEQVGKPFSGPAGEILNDVFTELNIPDWRNRFYITYVYKYRVPGNNLKRIGEVCNEQEQISNLWREIRTINPNCILALGKAALHAVTGKHEISDYRGSILNCKDGAPKVVPTIHPANLLNKNNNPDSDISVDTKKQWPYIWHTIMQLDIEKAVKESQTPGLYKSNKIIRIANDYYTLYKFFETNKHRKVMFTDVETYRNTLVTCMSFAFDEHEAVSVLMLRKIENLILSTRSDTESSAIWQLIDKILREKLISGHNIKFDSEKIEMMGFKYGKIFSDTVIKAHVANPELPEFNLGFLQSIYTREPFHKNEGKEFQYGKHPIEDLLIYNAKDSANQADIDNRIGEEFTELDAAYGTDLNSFYRGLMNLYPIYQQMEKVGFRRDDIKTEYLKVKYDLWEEKLLDSLFQITGEEFNVNSWQQKGKFLYTDFGLNLPFRGKKGKKGDIPKTDANTMAALIANVIKDQWKIDAVNNMLAAVSVKKTKSVYIESESDYDGRLRSTYFQAGTENGRTSTGILSPPVRPYETGFAFQTLTKHGDIGSDIRSQLIADEGFVFVQIDKSQAEPRVVALLSEDYELLEAFDRGIDIHRRTAALALELTDKMVYDTLCPVADKIGKDSPERFIGKKTRNGGNYNMGKREFAINITTDARRFKIDVNISEWKAGRILERFHQANSKVRSVFHANIINALQNTRCLISPYGRIRRFFGRMDDRLFKEGFACIPQSTVKDSLNENMIDIWNRNFPIKFMGEAHDAILFQMPINEYKDICKEIKPIMQKPIDFSRCSLKRGTLIIPCDFEVGENYKDLEKLKW